MLLKISEFRDRIAYDIDRPGSRIYADPLCEVGCPYSVRGFDFDSVGILWMSDLVWRDGRWQVNPEYIHETGTKRLLSAARKEKQGFEFSRPPSRRKKPKERTSCQLGPYEPSPLRRSKGLARSVQTADRDQQLTRSIRLRQSILSTAFTGKQNTQLNSQ